MPEWDEDSPRLQRNLRSVLRRIRDSARSRELPTVDEARHWHAEIMAGLDLPDTRFAGAFRGEAGADFEHAEWIRIHPFVNGNGRTARLWANSLAMRYGLPPFVRLRPRPDDGYGAAGDQAMLGNWEPTATVLRRMLLRLLDEADHDT